MLKKNLPTILSSKTPKIYKNKKLNNANFGDFTHGDYQVFLILISKLGGVDAFGKYLQPEQLEREHILSAKEFSQIFNTDINNSYRFIHKACKKLMKTSIILQKPELSETWEINICSTAKYNKNQGTITIEFTDRIMPYLSQMRQKFVLYNLKEIANFGSLYTTRLYELIQDFKETGWMIKSVEQLRVVFAVGKKFKSYKDFKKCTFEHACKEINHNYDIGLRFEEIKEGRKVVEVKFFFKASIPKQVVNKITEQVTTIYEKPKQKNITKGTRKPKTVAVSLNNSQIQIPVEQNIPTNLQPNLSISKIVNKEDKTLDTKPKTLKSILTSLFSKLINKN